MNNVLQKITNQFKGKKVLIVGLGLQGGGQGLAAFFAEIGSIVTVTDLKSEEELQPSVSSLSQYNIRYVFGKHDRTDFLESDYIFIGPSIKWDMPQIIEAENKGIPVDMEASFFVSYCPAPIIGITGTRGKSTTTQMIFDILKQAGLSVCMGGNVRNSSTISLLKTISKNDVVVLELSSWQLSAFDRKKISPHISVFTNFYPDHQNYYASMRDYWRDKAAIFKYQNETDFLVANEMLKTDITSKSKTLYFDADTFPGKLLIQGQHNKENAGAAFLVSKIMNIPDEKIIQTLSEFKGLAYRIDKRDSINGVEIYNDTTSTTPIAAQTAITTFNGKRITIILGGNSKNLPYDDLIKTLANVSAIVLLKGSFTDEIYPHLDKSKIKGEIYTSLEDAVGKGLEVSRPGDVLLFSPGATSFAQFKNEFDRGEQFDKVINIYAQNTKKSSKTS
jgi:UDP-N-acetylmuramoylalanine--D-glutamate ligase